jgi:hypothetical protein
MERQKEFSDIVKATQIFKAKLVNVSSKNKQLFKSLSQRAFRGELL